MKLVVQRVNSARVTEVKSGKTVGKIEKGLLVLLGIGKTDTEKDADYLVGKLLNLRIMSDNSNKINLSIVNVNAALLVVSQFTLYADTAKGNRPSFTSAEEPSKAEYLYGYFVGKLKEANVRVETGSFGEYMRLDCDLDGPVTILLER